MASSRNRSPDVAYPQLHKEQIDIIIESLIAVIRDRDLGARINLAESTASDLTGFYTRRWGMPPAITRRVERIRELAGG